MKKLLLFLFIGCYGASYAQDKVTAEFMVVEDKEWLGHCGIVMVEGKFKVVSFTDFDAVKKGDTLTLNIGCPADRIAKVTFGESFKLDLKYNPAPRYGYKAVGYYIENYTKIKY